MALSGTVNGKVTYLSSYYTYYFTWSAEQNIEENYSDVTVSTYWGHSGGYTFDTVSARSASITINGTKKSISKRFDYYPWVTDPIQTETVRVYHNDDGTKKITISTRSNGHANTYGPSASINSSDDCTASAEITLDTIPRPSSFSLENDERKPGETQKITIVKKNSALKSKLEWSCGTKSGTISSSTADISVNWDIPLSLIKESPKASQICKIILTTLDTNENPVGSVVENSFKLANYNPTSISSISGDTIDSSVTINYSGNSNFTYQSKWAFVDDNYTSYSTSMTFIPSLDKCGPKIPNATSGKLKCYLKTLYDGVEIGEKFFEKTINLASSVRPKMGTISIIPQNVLTDTSKYIQNYSKVKVTLSSSEPKGGASISSIKANIEGVNYDLVNDTVTSNILKNTEYNKLTVTVTDSRGRSVSAEKGYTLDVYTKPNLNDISVTRSSDLTSFTIKGNSIWMLLDGKNSGTLQVQYKKTSDTSYSSPIDIFKSATTEQNNISKTISGLDNKATYNVKLILKDELDEISSIYTLRGASIGYDMNKDGLGIRKYWEQGALDVEGAGYFSGELRAEKVYNAVWGDYAEFFPRGEETEPGDIVALDLDAVKEIYIKATYVTGPAIGVHSDEYGHILGGENVSLEENMKNYIPIGLAGRVWVKVKGSPKKGDYIGVSDTPGVGSICENKYNAIGICVDNNLKDGKCRIKII